MTFGSPVGGGSVGSRSLFHSGQSTSSSKLLVASLAGLIGPVLSKVSWLWREATELTISVLALKLCSFTFRRSERPPVGGSCTMFFGVKMALSCKLSDRQDLS